MTARGPFRMCSRDRGPIWLMPCGQSIAVRFAEHSRMARHA